MEEAGAELDVLADGGDIVADQLSLVGSAGEVAVELEDATDDAGEVFPDDGGGGVLETVVGEEAA